MKRTNNLNEIDRGDHELARSAVDPNKEKRKDTIERILGKAKLKIAKPTKPNDRGYNPYNSGGSLKEEDNIEVGDHVDHHLFRQVNGRWVPMGQRSGRVIGVTDTHLSLSSIPGPSDTYGTRSRWKVKKSSVFGIRKGPHPQYYIRENMRQLVRTVNDLSGISTKDTVLPQAKPRKPEKLPLITRIRDYLDRRRATGGRRVTATNEHIVKISNKFRLVSKKTGENLGTYTTRVGAKNRERQVQYFKTHGE